MTLFTSKLKKLTTAALLMSVGSVSVLSHAEVTLLVDDNIKVTAINGQELKQSIFQPLTKQFTLQPGQHVLTAKYDRLYNLPRDEHDYLRSGNISVAADLTDNQTYRLTMPGQPEDYDAAKEYAQQPTLAVQQNNTVIASQQSVAGNDGSIFSGLGKAIGGVFGGSGDAQLQNQQAIAALGQPTANSQAIAQVNARPAVVTSNAYSAIPVKNVSQATATQSTATLDQFMQLWLQATPAEREKMRQWAEK
ncbi:DUF2057 family protein [Psychrobacter sp. M13]|uniref:DUF2057 family protein n=1 Tax=Psychrobacter sp. M13 TaxID=3067275 RepID=UPI00273C8F10|nr:DUF2057 family protein [Psychrobacter sp. M13]WLP93826.1 DUF2057 family protein [Psychrobacter sp. M13]